MVRVFGYEYTSKQCIEFVFDVGEAVGDEVGAVGEAFSEAMCAAVSEVVCAEVGEAVGRGGGRVGACVCSFTSGVGVVRVCVGV